MSDYLQSGSSTSAASAKRRSDMELRALAELGVYPFIGTTWKELAESSGAHHGSASGILSRLHKEGRIARLTETREACHVYVLPEFVNGRQTQPHGGQAVQRKAAINAVEAVRRVHVAQSVTKFASNRELITEERCSHDRYAWPCPTIAAIDNAIANTHLLEIR